MVKTTFKTPFSVLIVFSILVLFVFGKSKSDIDLDYKNNFYIILSSSKFFFNYRHTGNTMALYKYLKDRGITDDRILLMLPENHACNARSYKKGHVKYMLNDKDTNYYCEDVEVDYKSDDLTYEAILNLFRGRYAPDFPENKKLKTNEDSKIFVFFNGHGGDNFFKIQDTEVLQSADLAKVYQEMHEKRKYKEIWMIMETCEAMSLFDDVNTPNLILFGTSPHGKSAYSDEYDQDYATNINEKWIHNFMIYLKDGRFNAQAKLIDFEKHFPMNLIDSKIGFKNTLVDRELKDVLVHEYFPLPNNVIKGTEYYNLEDVEHNDILQ